jgi:molecular chaperone DnaK
MYARARRVPVSVRHPRTRNFYSRQAGEIDYTNASRQVREEAQEVSARAEAVAGTVQDSRLDQALEKLTRASAIDRAETDAEAAKEAMDGVLAAKKLLANVRKDHIKEIRQLDLDNCSHFFNANVRQHARPAEVGAFENLLRTAQRSIDSNSTDFEQYLSELRQKNFEILWRQDWFVVERFKWLTEAVHLFPDPVQHDEPVAAGRQAMNADDIENLRRVVTQLDYLRIGSGPESDMLAPANILRG